MTEATATTETAAAPAAEEQQTTQQPAGNLLTQQQQTEDPLAWMPEKYRVNNDAGQFDVEASARKLAEGNAALAKRLGSGDVRPATVEDYAPEINVEGITVEDLKGDERYNEFLAKAHAKGYTNDQVSFAINEFLDRELGVQAGEQAMSSDQAEAALREVWASDKQFSDGIADARRAIGVSPAADRLMQKYGTDPDFIQFAAMHGKDLREDTSVPNASTLAPVDFNAKASELRKEMMTLTAQDPRRVQINKELDEMYSNRYGNKPVTRSVGITL